MNRHREWLPRLLVESAVVVFSILLALAVNEWWDQRETEAAVQRSLRSIQGEMERNRSRLEEVARYHRELADTLKTLVNAGAEEVPEGVPAHGWLQTPELTSAAWRGAGTTGTASEMPHDLVLILSEAYREQEQYEETRQAIVPVLYDILMERGQNTLRPMFRPLSGIISDVASWEAQLLKKYERALEELEGRIEE